MARALGRRPDEISSAESQKRGLETWAVGLPVIVIAAIAIAIVAYAAH